MALCFLRIGNDRTCVSVTQVDGLIKAVGAPNNLTNPHSAIKHIACEYFCAVVASMDPYVVSHITMDMHVHKYELQS